MVKENMKKQKVQETIKLDLGCGNNKQQGFKGVDFVKTEATDVVHDLFKFPWPFKDNSVDEVFCSHFFEHVPQLLRGKFMDEAYRIMKPGSKFTIITPYYSSTRAVQDFTHQWPPLCEHSYLYFNKKWRQDNKLTHGHYDIKCDFDFSWGFSADPGFVSRSEEVRNFANRHYINAIMDLHTILTKRESP